MPTPHTSPEQLQILLARARAQGRSPEVMVRLGWFLRFMETRSVQRVCRDFGIARSTFYRWLHRFDPADLGSLEDKPTVTAVHLRSGSPLLPPALPSTIERARERMRSAIGGGDMPDRCSGCLLCRLSTFLAAPGRGWVTPLILLSMFLNLVFLLSLLLPTVAAASSWNPAVLVNTEAFQVIDDADTAVDLKLQFGDTLNKTLTFERSADRFQFNDDLLIQGNLTVTGTMSGASTITFTALKNCDTIDTNGNGVLACGVDAGGGGGITQADGDARYVNQSGDGMTGSLAISSGNPKPTAKAGLLLEILGAMSGNTLRVSAGGADVQGALNASGAIRTDSDLTINADIDTNNAILTFGSDTQSETLTWANTADRFEFSDDLEVIGNISGSTITIMSGTSYVLGKFFIGKSTGTAQFEVNGAMSGSSLYLSRAFSGAGLLDCDTAGTSKLLWDVTTGRFSCGTDQGGSGLSQSDGDARYVNQSGDGMTGSLAISSGNPKPTAKAGLLLEVLGTISGSQLRASNMTVSGAVVYTSGSSLFGTAKGSSGQLLISQATATPRWKSTTSSMVWYLDGVLAVGTRQGATISMPFGFTATDVFMRVSGAPTGAALIVDINTNGGTSLFSTRPQINAGAVRGGTGAVFSTTNIAKDTEVSVDIDQVGSTFAGSGLTLMLNGTRKY